MPQFATKADWASAKAKECDEAAAERAAEYVHYTKLASKNATVAFLRSEAVRYRGMAETYRKKGL